MLILDEASSNLDSENERRIQQALELLHGHLTILIVTHRLSTVRDADIIYVLEDGDLVESGTWDELLASEHGRLRALCSAQGIEPGSAILESSRAAFAERAVSFDSGRQRV